MRRMDSQLYANRMGLLLGVSLVCSSSFLAKALVSLTYTAEFFYTMDVKEGLAMFTLLIAVLNFRRASRLLDILVIISCFALVGMRIMYT